MELLPSKQGSQGEDADNLCGRIDRYIVPAGLSPWAQDAQGGFFIAEKIPFLRGYLRGRGYDQGSACTSGKGQVGSGSDFAAGAIMGADLTAVSASRY